MAKKNKKKNKVKEEIRIYFRDGKKDIIPGKLWDDYEYVHGDANDVFVVIKNEAWRYFYNMKDITAISCNFNDKKKKK